MAARPWMAVRKRRLLLALLALCGLYLFVKNIPTDVPSVAHRTDTHTGQSWARPKPFTDRIPPGQDKNVPISQDATGTRGTSQLYEGPVKFYRLAESLRPYVYHAAFDKPRMVFALYDLRSATALVSFACEVAAHNRSDVHVAVIAPRDDPLDEIAALNGLDKSDCPLHWHDARPDYNTKSSPARRKNIARAQIGHVNAALKASLFVIDEAQTKPAEFFDAFRQALDSVQMPLLTLPRDPLHSVSWMASLDADALRLINDIQIDIHITPQAGSSGSLLRLLESIQEANYAGVPTPRITVDLSSDVEQSALSYLQNMRWPQGRDPSASQLVLRKKIGASTLPPDLAAVRTIESFYPSSWPKSHILVLSPDVELGRDYMQFLMYTTLAYKDSQAGDLTAEHLMGIALDFSASPAMAASGDVLILQQKPSAKAAMYFGDRWVELQSWLSHRLRKDPSLARSLLSKTEQDLWLSEVQMLMQARNHFMLYPSFAQSADTKLVTVHTELSHDYDLYNKKPMFNDEDNSAAISKILSDSVLDGDVIAPTPGKIDQAHNQLPLVHLLSSSQTASSKSGPPAALDLRLFTGNGEVLTREQAQDAANKFADQVSLELGDCSSLDVRPQQQIGSIDYLFCDPDLAI